MTGFLDRWLGPRPAKIHSFGARAARRRAARPERGPLDNPYGLADLVDMPKGPPVHMNREHRRKNKIQ